MAQQPLAELFAFMAVARRKSFRQASVDFGVSASAVSPAMRQLEQPLSLRLLNRTTRSVALTEAGQRLFERLEPAFEGIDSAVEELNLFREAPYGTLRINAPRQAARLVLTPTLADFAAAHPHMRVEVTGGDPATVRLWRRVVRLSSRTPSHSSSMRTCLPTIGPEMPKTSPAAAKEPVSAARTKACRLASRSIYSEP